MIKEFPLSEKVNAISPKKKTRTKPNNIIYLRTIIIFIPNK
jgi:hypothetical protein